MNQRVQQVDFPYENLLSVGFHSKYNTDTYPVVGNVPILPLRTDYRGPAATLTDVNEPDVIDEALDYFRPHMFSRQFKPKGGADRVMIYCYLYMIECCKQLHGFVGRDEALRKLKALAISNDFPLPGNRNFPCNDFFEPPKDAKEEETMKAYFQQLRGEVGERLWTKIFDHESNVADKHWTMFGHRRFLNRSFTR
uniref:Actin-related protein 2/3 complex subunit 3 n=1 Tax=Panagrolaimus sp. JU765 TaxID=591449 RepID=A0AC34PUA1_9BILA